MGITDEQKRVYEQIMADPEYKMTIATSGSNSDPRGRKAFNEKYKMKVFAYNAEGEKDTVMTPPDSIRYLSDVPADRHCSHRNRQQAGSRFGWAASITSI
ncbi:MAG: hypothetical protein IPI42_04845 [Saprospiraceae bacterium]|nr:hypothetical protein [Candidatus Parvibacillus calidus]